MLFTLIPLLALVALRFDAFVALARASASIPSHGRRRTLDYRALANVEAGDVQRLLRGAELPDLGRRAALVGARARAADTIRSLDMAGRFALDMRRTARTPAVVFADAPRSPLAERVEFYAGACEADDARRRGAPEAEVGLAQTRAHRRRRDFDDATTRRVDAALALANAEVRA